MKNLKKIELNMKTNVAYLSNHAKKSYNHRARGDYNAELLYSPLKIVLKPDSFSALV